MAHLCHYLTALAAKNPDAELTFCQGRSKTAWEVLCGVAALSQTLQQLHGVQPGDRVAMVAQNTDHFLQALLAICAAGAIAVPLNLRWSPHEAEAAVALVSARLVCIEQALLPVFGQLGQAPGRACLVLHHSPPQSAIRQQSGSSTEHQAAIAGRLQIQSTPDNAALICFTSGTSGSPKGVLLSHASLHAQAMAKLLLVGYNADDVYLHCAPLCHIGGLSSMTALLAVGGKQVFLPAFDAASALALIERHSVTALIAVPAMVVSLLDAASSSSRSGSSQDDSSSSGYPSVRRVLLGGGELPARLQWRLRLLFPCAQLFTAYGMTEACSSITFSPLDVQRQDFSAAHRHTEAARPAGVCVGMPPPGIDVAILQLTEAVTDSSRSTEADHHRPHARPAAAQDVDVAAARDHGTFAEPGTAGEVLTRGPHVMLGYWGDASASACATLQPGGWLRTGDLGLLDARGRLWLLGRLKDVVRSGSENVSAAEVERVLNRLPGVATAAVVGLPHPRLGEQVAALLVLRDGVHWEGSGRAPQHEEHRETSANAAGSERREEPLSPARAMEFCKEQGLSSFMVPRIVLVQREPLPVNSSGKVLKQAVRQRMLQLLESGVQPVLSRI